MTPLLERPHVTNLLGVDKLADAIPSDVVPHKIIESIEEFCTEWGYAEIVIQYDNDVPPLGIILDAYEGEDNVDSRTIWFMDYQLPF